MIGAHLASPIMGNLGYAHRPQLGKVIHSIFGEPNFGPSGQEDVCTNFALTKFVFSNSGNFREKANPPKPRSYPKYPLGQWMGQNPSADWSADCRAWLSSTAIRFVQIVKNIRLTLEIPVGLTINLSSHDRLQKNSEASRFHPTLQGHLPGWTP